MHLKMASAKFVYASWLKDVTESFMKSYNLFEYNYEYCQISNIRCTLADYKTVDHSDVVGASSVGAAPTTSSFST